MKKSALLIIIATAALISCGEYSNSRPKTVETINSVRNYEYADVAGNRLVIHNSGPKGGIKYTALDGEEYGYVGFWTQVTNETRHPLELKIDFPLDSFEFPSATGRYIKLLIPSDTMTADKAALPDYGLNVPSFLDSHRFKASSLKRTVNPSDSLAFHVVILSKWNPTAGGSGAMRTGLSLKGSNLVYKISAYKMTPDLPLTGYKEISCGSISLKNLTLRNK
jgi:hypothetical protein